MLLSIHSLSCVSTDLKSLRSSSWRKRKVEGYQSENASISNYTVMITGMRKWIVEPEYIKEVS